MLWDYAPAKTCETDGCEVTAPHSHLPTDQRAHVTGGKLIGYFQLLPDAHGRIGFLPVEIADDETHPTS